MSTKLQEIFNFRHWTEHLGNDAEATDRDDWEWDRQDDFGDPWDDEAPAFD